MMTLFVRRSLNLKGNLRSHKVILDVKINLFIFSYLNQNHLSMQETAKSKAKAASRRDSKVLPSDNGVSGPNAVIDKLKESEDAATRKLKEQEKQNASLSRFTIYLLLYSYSYLYLLDKILKGRGSFRIVFCKGCSVSISQ